MIKFKSVQEIKDAYMTSRLNGDESSIYYFALKHCIQNQKMCEHCEYFIKQDCWCSYLYARKIIKGRFLLGENVIKENPKIWNMYKLLF